MILRHAWRELGRNPGRTALTVLGVAVSGAMLLDMLMLSRGMQTSFRELLLERGYELRVTPPGTLPFDTDATLAGARELRARLEERPEVASVAPVLGANLIAEGEEEVRVFALGVDPEEQGVFRLVSGRPPRASDEVVVGREAAARLRASAGSRLALRVGRGLGGEASAGGARRTVEVVGTAEFLYAAPGERPVALPLATVAEMTGRPDRASFLMARAAGGVPADTAAARLSRAFPDVEVASVGELVRRAQRRLSYFRQLALILGTVSLLVAVLLVGTVTAVSVHERFGTIAALRAMGFSRRTLMLSLGAEGALLTAVGAAGGLGLGLVTARFLEGILSDFPGLPRAVRFFVADPSSIAVAFGVLVLAGAAAVQLPAWRAASAEIAPALHEEEP